MRGRNADDGTTPRTSRHDYWGVYLDAPDARGLARFYAELLGWTVHRDSETDVVLAPPDGVAYLGFQTSDSYVPPVWPPVDDAQQMMLHLDFEVEDLDAATTHAVELGSRRVESQPLPGVRTLLDPAGHPFDLYVDEP